MDSDSDYHTHRSFLMRADINIFEFSVMILAIIAGIILYICVWIFMVPVRALRSLFMLLGNVRDELEAFSAMRIPAMIRDEEHEDEDGDGETAIEDDEMDFSEETIVELEEVFKLATGTDEKAGEDEIVSINCTGSSWVPRGWVRRDGT
jgi:hypothetical protein